jgi:hypothetical protein
VLHVPRPMRLLYHWVTLAVTSLTMLMEVDGAPSWDGQVKSPGLNGWLAIHWFGGGLPALFTAIAVALVAYGTMVAGAVKAGARRETAARFPESASVRAADHLSSDREN